ncbi:MAG: sulfurtransferase [Blastocatellia bacterium]|nr:sulfurtransferase [Blastocatellia bacterium]
MKRIFFLILISIPLISVTAQKTKPVAVRKQMLVSTDWLAKNLQQAKLVLIHVGRGTKNYDAGHIPGARFLDYGDLIVTRSGVVNELPPVEKLQQLFAKLGVNNDSRVVLLCEGQGIMAARTYWTLDYLGLGDNAALLDGGLEKWKAEKREVSTTAPEIKAGNFTPRLHPKVMVSREAVRDISWVTVNGEPTDTVILDARQPEGYTGEMKRPDFPLNGHIPGAGNVYWMNTLTSKESPTLKPIAELQKMYEEAGLTPGKKVVTYCWIGMMASHGYFTLKYLGYDVAMYDGSFTEWAKSEGVTVVTGKNRK